MPLTELQIKALRSDKGKPVRVFDSGGLYIEATAAGTKRWHLKYRIDGKYTTKALGQWPEVNVKRARELVYEFKASLKNPQIIEAPSMTFAELAEDWMTRFKDRYSVKEIRRRRDYLDRLIFPSIGNCKADIINPVIVLNNVLRPIENDNYLETVKKVKSLIGIIMRYGVTIGQAKNDPVISLKGALKSRLVRHRAAIIEPERVGKLIADIKMYNGTVSTAFALNMLPYIFVRPGELRNAEWREFNFAEGIWRIPEGRMKMKAPHLVPLSTQVTGLLEELKKYDLRSKYLFPGIRSKDKPISDMTINAALRYLGYAQDEICAHGFRAMASTLLNERGYNSDWIEKQLAHSERSSVRAAYNHADYLPERRKMMQDWADYLDSLAISYSESRR
jgi:integrase